MMILPLQGLHQEPTRVLNNFSKMLKMFIVNNKKLQLSINEVKNLSVNHRLQDQINVSLVKLRRMLLASLQEVD